MLYSIYELIWFFFLYSFLAWVAVEVVTAIRRRTVPNMGFLNLPFIPVYGVAAVIFSIFLPELRDAPVFLFLAGGVLTAVCLSLANVALERIFHRRWRDYTNSFLPFNGRLTFVHVAAGGLGALLCILVVNPLVSPLVKAIPRPWGLVILIVLCVLLAADGAVASAALAQIKIRLRRCHAPQELFGRFLNGIVQRRMVRAYPELQAEKLVESEQAYQQSKGQAVFAQGCSFHKLVWLFVIAAFLGDIIETIFCYVTAGILMSRSSVVWGPFSIVWGLGGVLLTALLYQYREKSDRYVFFAGTIIGGVYEYMCSVFSELVCGTVFWDYSAIPFNLGGRINLLYCFFWGIAGVVWIKGIYPRLSALIERIPIRPGKILTWVLLVFMLLNMLVSSLALARYTVRQTTGEPPKNAIEQLLDDRFPNERMARIYPNAQLVE